MDIWENNKLLLFIGFVIPGFISLKTYELLYPSERRESNSQLIDAIAYSCINYALLFWPIYEIEINQIYLTYPRTYIAFYAFVLLIAPIVWVFLLKILRSTGLLQRSFPHPIEKPWDYIFSQGKPYWIIVTLKDGKQIAGRYDSRSFASSAPAPEQLYLEETWILNEDTGFERPRSETAGIMVLGPDIVTIEFFKMTDGELSDAR